jgi:flagellar M-ring protein FliF
MPAADTVPATKLSPLQQLRSNPRLPLYLGGAAAAIALIAAALLWSRGPEYRVLYTNLSDRDGGAIVASLQQMNIPYKLGDGGAVLVAANQVHEARLRLASTGLPKGGAAGFELMDNQKFGTSQFAEQVNYQRALEGELARSIESISAVESARVHLALPKQSLFVRDQQKPSASVVLKLYPGRTIDDAQVGAMTHLISSSVPELIPKNVTVVDQHGNMLSMQNAARGLDATQLKYTQEIEQTYARRVEAILQPIFGEGNVRAQVAADIDFSVVENTDEKYGPNQTPGSAAVRSQQSSDSEQQNATPPIGIPGALSNQPPPTPVAPIATGKDGVQLAGRNGNSTMRKDVTTNYEVDRSIRHVQQNAGAIKRLTAAVLVNHKPVLNAQGKPVFQALTPAELEKVTNLAREAMGFKAERGDSLNVVNSAFSTNMPDGPPLPWYRETENISLAKTGANYLLGLVLLLVLWFGTARPLLRKRTQPEGEASAAGTEGEDPAEAIAKAATEAAEKAKLTAEAEKRVLDRYHENMEFARMTAQKEPRLVAMVIKGWMESSDEDEK